MTLRVTAYKTNKVVKTTITTSVNAELKAQAFEIIRFEYRKSFSQWLEEKLSEVVNQVNKNGK